MGKLAASDDEDDDHGLDDPVCTVPSGQQKVAKTGQQKDDEDQADLRFAGSHQAALVHGATKAVEAHLLSQAARAAEQNQNNAARAHSIASGRSAGTCPQGACRAS